MENKGLPAPDSLAAGEAFLDAKIRAGKGQQEHVGALDGLFGRRVREERERLRMPQQHIATVMTLSYGHRWHQTTVAKVESGERPVKLSEAVAVSYILGVPLVQLIDQHGSDGASPASTQLAMVELARMEQYISQRRNELTKTAER